MVSLHKSLYISDHCGQCDSGFKIKEVQRSNLCTVSDFYLTDFIALCLQLSESIPVCTSLFVYTLLSYRDWVIRNKDKKSQICRGYIVDACINSVCSSDCYYLSGYLFELLEDYLE